MSWKVENLRPEDVYKHPIEFYTAEEIKRFSKSNSMRKTQIEIADRMLDLAGISEGKILDMGCGAGFVLMMLKNIGFDAVGVDVVEAMVDVCKGKRLKAFKADMRELPFEDKTFDSAVSVSALQWLTSSKDAPKNIRSVAKELHRVLKANGRAAFQFYPRSEEQLVKTASMFSRNGFEAKVAIDNPDNPRKRLCFIILKKN